MKLPLVCLSLFGLLLCNHAIIAQLSHPVTVTRITGEQVEFSIDRVVDGVVYGQGKEFDLADLVIIDAKRSLVRQKDPVQISLVTGGVCGVKDILFDGEQFQVDAVFNTWVMPPDSIRGILFNQEADRARYDRALENRSLEEDVLIARTKDGQGRVGGILEAISDAKVTMNYGGRSRSVSRERVVAVVTADLKPKLPEGAMGLVTLTNGSTLGGVVTELKGGLLSLGVPGNATIAIPFEQVASISLSSDRVTYLSDLEPLEAECIPMVTLPFTWQRDLSVRRQPLSIYSWEQGKTIGYGKGIGTHAASRLEFANPDGFNRFVATVGIAAETAGKGDCEVSVWGDGIQLWESQLSGRDEAKAIDLDISGIQKISLVVRNGRHLDLSDHVNWANARFLKIGN
ncbi:MAG: NPCBM/NEW2 domain-containing protein [Pirellulaceae bacterium]|nr:NPCBM/NEW2 domain-containing protein [Pirellulaceae bacterium]MDG2104893.1 NPCBM/NEW2 domain-containing protein [Pirellulaceae bacterium]